MNERMIELHLGGLSNVKILGGKFMILLLVENIKFYNF